MAKVPLRKYNREIESLIEHGQMDEAIAHCRHILETFPKHLETYRLLGKAYLESKRYSDATDIFNRILMAVPDDFVSHVGLSIIADNQKRLDDALWHMERAFEKQPSNAAIQAELQRLYGRRDGHEPPKIRLNRGALAHMYYQGELYMQSVSEIRSVLTEDPSRTDLQCLLALAYFRAGQKVEASEIFTQLLGQFPYCLEANRALIEILPGTEMAENAEIYRQRVVELDPYAAHVRGSIFQTDGVPDDSVSLERLEYKGKPVESSPDWGKSLGIEAGAAAASSAQPDWLKKGMDPASAPPSVKAFSEEIDTPRATFEPIEAIPGGGGPSVESREPAQPEGGAIPDWMRKAGWGESTGAFDESAASISEEPAEGELVKADLPDWIKSMAPKEAEPAAAAPEASSTDEDTLDWLNKLGGDKPFGSVPVSGSSQEAAFEETPKEAQPEDVPGWLSRMGDSGQSAASGAAALTADWLSKLDLDDKEIPSSGPAEEITPAADSISPVLSGAGEGIGNLGTSAAEQDEALLWLESLAAKQGAKSEELISKPEDRLEKPPEWVEQAREAVESQPVNQMPGRAAPLSEPDWGEADLTEAVPSELVGLDRTGGWLNELEGKKSKAEKTIGADSTAWSGEIEITPPSPSPEAQSASEEEIPLWLRGSEGHADIPPAGPIKDMPDWIKGEGHEEPVIPEPTRAADWTPEAKVAAPSIAPEPAKPAVRKPEPKREAADKEDITKVRRVGMLPPLIDPNLASARAVLSRGKIPDALSVYGNLIRKGKLLEDITFDLKEALYRFPVEVAIWQALGDAYMRSNRLQDALDAYTKAEELLR